MMTTTYTYMFVIFYFTSFRFDSNFSQRCSKGCTSQRKCAILGNYSTILKFICKCIHNSLLQLRKSEGKIVELPRCQPPSENTANSSEE